MWRISPLSPWMCVKGCWQIISSTSPPIGLGQVHSFSSAGMFSLSDSAVHGDSLRIACCIDDHLGVCALSRAAFRFEHLIWGLLISGITVKIGPIVKIGSLDQLFRSG